MPASMRNLELKARDPDPPASLERALALGRRRRGRDRAARHVLLARAGRLKLREQQPGGAELIAYRRDDEPGARARATTAACRRGGARCPAPGARRRPGHAGGGDQAPPAADLGGRAHPSGRGRGPRGLPRAGGRRAARARTSSPSAERVERLRAELRYRGRRAGGEQLLRPAARRCRRRCSPPPRRPCATPTRPTPASGSGRRCERRRGDLRRRERGERLLPAGPVRRGVRAGGAGGGRGARDRRGRGGGGAAGDLPALRRLPPAPGRAGRARDAGLPRAPGRAARRPSPWPSCCRCSTSSSAA